MIQDYTKMAFRNLKKRRLRSFLTLLGIVIAIASIFVLISLSLGLQSAVEEQFRQLGTDKFFIQPRGQAGAPGSGGAVELTLDDVNVIKKVHGVKTVGWYVAGTVKVEANDQIRYTMALGGDMENFNLLTEGLTLKLDEGRFLEKDDTGKVMLGSQYKYNNYLRKPIKSGDKISINDIEFKVKGIFQPVGSPPDDRLVTMSSDDFRELFDIPNRVDAIVVQIDEGENVRDVADSVERKLMKYRDVTEKTKDFSVSTPEEILASFGVILQILTSFLVGIAAISLLVGGVNIANTMFTSVLERTREIGVMKAIGAQNKDILLIFLIESGLLGIVGGIMGIALGIGIGKFVEYIAIAQLGTNLLKAVTPFYLILGTLAFSFLIGAISGLWPAWRATKIKPVEALRYE